MPFPSDRMVFLKDGGPKSRISPEEGATAASGGFPVASL